MTSGLLLLDPPPLHTQSTDPPEKLQLRKEVSAGCTDAVQQAQRLAAAMQSDLVGRLQQQEAATQQALKQQQTAQEALEQQHTTLTQQLKEQAAAATKQQEVLAQQQKQQAEQQAAAMAKATAGLRDEVDGKLSELELLLTGRVNDTSAGKAALTDSKLAEIR